MGGAGVETSYVQCHPRELSSFCSNTSLGISNVIIHVSQQQMECFQDAQLVKRIPSFPCRHVFQLFQRSRLE